MRNTIICFLFFLLGACSILKESPKEPISQDTYGLLFSLVIEHSDTNIIKQNGIQAVQIYQLQYSRSGKLKDSVFIEYKDLDYYERIPKHTLFKIEYDSLGRYSKRYGTRVESGKRSLNDYYVYGENSLPKEWISLNADGTVNSKTFFLYNSQKQLIKKEKWGGYSIYPEAALEKETHYEYRSLGDSTNSQYLGKAIEYSKIYRENSFNSRLIKTFNAKGQEINYQVESLEADSVRYTWGTSSTYQKDGKLIREGYRNSEGEEHETIYTYNSKGLLSEMYRFDKIDKKPLSNFKFYYTQERSGWEHEY